MPLALPPPAPQQAEVETLRASAGTLQIAWQQYRLYLNAPAGMGEDRVRGAVASADNLSNAVRAIAALARAAGYPAARVLYALSGNDLFITVSAGGLSGSEGDTRYTPYFAGLAQTQPLSDAALEPRRILATAHADRAGETVTGEWLPDGENFRLKLRSDPSQPDSAGAGFSISNPGSRFVGRHFVDLSLNKGTQQGDDFRVLVRKDLAAWNDDQKSEHYEEGNFSWSRVTPYGIFGSGLRGVEYDVKLSGNIYNGQMLQGEMYWFYPLSARQTQRWSLIAKLDRTRKTTDLTGGAQLQSELYSSAELAQAWSQRFTMYERPLTTDLSLTLRQGLSDEKLQISSAQGDYFLWRPAARLSSTGATAYGVTLEVSAQLSADTVPEQSQWVIGGLGSLTAFLPGLAVGDRGISGRVLADIGSYDLWDVSWKPRLLAEYASAEFSTLAPGKPAAVDAGFELNGQINRWLSLTLAYAECIADRDLSDAALAAADANLHFRINARFN